jgi:peroxiredoxin
VSPTHTPSPEPGVHATDFSLPGTDGKTHTLSSCRGERGLLVAFICNHCPYVLAIRERLVEDCRALQAIGIGVVAISSNDTVTYPEDSFPRMGEFAIKNKFTFPYLYDESQAVARAYGAVCTPDFFGYAADLTLQYRGRLDDARSGQGGPARRRELVDAMTQIARTGCTSIEQVPSMGCSLKWKR